MSRTKDRPHETEADGTSPQTESRLLPDTFSPKHFVLSLLLIFIIHIIGRSSFPIIPPQGMVAIAVAALALGGFDNERRFLEIGVAGGVAGGVFGVISPLLAIPLLGIIFNILTIIAGGVTGVIVALVFHFIGSLSGR